MSGVKQFHKKEAAKILIELRNKTEDVTLMDYRRQLLQIDSNLDETQCFNDFQERLEQSLWPWAYPSPPLAPYGPHTVPFGYPYMSNTPVWIPPPSCVDPPPPLPRYNVAPPFQGMDFQHALTWPQLAELAASHSPGFADPGNVSRRRRTKFTNEQLAILEKTFTHGSKFPSPGERMRLETKTGLSKEKISVWFQNRRAKEKREKCQEESNKETEESTTDSEENETEDEVHLRVCDNTAEEESEVEIQSSHSTTSFPDEKNEPMQVNQAVFCDKEHYSTGRKRARLPLLTPCGMEEDTNTVYVRNTSKESDVIETFTDDNEPDVSKTCDLDNSDIAKNLLNVVDVTENDDDTKSKRDESRLQTKRQKLCPGQKDLLNFGSSA